MTLPVVAAGAISSSKMVRAGATSCSWHSTALPLVPTNLIGLNKFCTQTALTAHVMYHHQAASINMSWPPPQ